MPTCARAYAPLEFFIVLMIVSYWNSTPTSGYWNMPLWVPSKGFQPSSLGCSCTAQPLAKLLQVVSSPERQGMPAPCNKKRQGSDNPRPSMALVCPGNEVPCWIPFSLYLPVQVCSGLLQADSEGQISYWNLSISWQEVGKSCTAGHGIENGQPTTFGSQRSWTRKVP